MRTGWTLITLFFLASPPGLAADLPDQADYYVAPQGNDDHPGTRDKPFATIGRAQAEVRAKIKSGWQKDLVVLIRGGRYELKDTLRFGPEDSGTARHSITYAAFSGEKPLLSGGRKISGWKAGAGQLWTLSLPEVKSGPSVRQLFLNEQRGQRARTPNQEDTHFRLTGAHLSKDLKTWQLTVAKGQLKNWQNIADAEVVVYQEWEILRKQVLAVEPATGIVTLAPPHPTGISHVPPRPGMWCYFENAPDMLDLAGEWYLDRTTGVLSYWPLPGQDMSRTDTFVPVLARLLEIKGTAERPVRNLHFRGLHFAHAEEPLPPFGFEGIQATYMSLPPKEPWEEPRVRAALEWTFAEGCSLSDGSLAHLGGSGLSLRQGCTGNTVQGNHIWDIGGTGINVGLLADNPKLLPRNNQIANNHIHACGRVYHGAVGVWTGFAEGTRIAHNLVHDLPYTGISAGWQWNPQPTSVKNNRIEYNHIHDVMRWLADGGGIYTLGFQPGTVLRGNLIHDVHYSAVAQQSRMSNNGMFIDEGSKGFRIEDNTIYNTAGPPIRFNQTNKDWHSWGENSLRGGTGKLAPGKVGQARAFGGLGDFVEAPAEPALDPPQLTVAAWIKLASVPGGTDNRRWLVGKNTNEWAEGHYGLIVVGKKVGAYLNIGGGKDNAFLTVSAEDCVTPNQWHHLAMTYDDAILKVYRDGAEAGAIKIQKPRRAGNGPLSIGRRPDGYVYFQGLIDEVRLYNRALSAEELKAQYQSPAPIVPKGEKSLVRSWSFDDEPKPPTSAAKAGLEPAYRKALLGEKR